MTSRKLMSGALAGAAILVGSTAYALPPSDYTSGDAPLDVYFSGATATDNILENTFLDLTGGVCAPGTIDIYHGGAVTERIFVVGGIAEVIPERCTVLADEAVAPSELSRAEIEADLQTVEGNLPSMRDQVGRAQGTERDRLNAELMRLEREQSVARAKLQALADIAC